MSAYRSAAIVVVGDVSPVIVEPHHDHAGPLAHCAGCGGELHYVGQRMRGCQGGARVFVRLFPWPRRCAKDGPHVHQRCDKCGFMWTVNPKGVRP